MDSKNYHTIIPMGQDEKHTMSELLDTIRMLETRQTELLNIIAEKDTKLDELLITVQAQSEQITELLARLGTNSTNSSQPPSQDKPTTRTRSLRGKSQRKPGGQVGHPGATLAMSPNPDTIVEHHPTCCRHCGHRIPTNAPSLGYQARQVFDLPPKLDLAITEHRLITVRCPHCLATCQGHGPDHVRRQVQYGQRIGALSVYLVAYHHIPLARASNLLHDLFGALISPATINKMITEAAQVINKKIRPTIHQILINAPIAHVDETGFNIAGKTRWAHCFSTPQATWIHVHDKRGCEAINTIGILPHFTGTLVHDAWRPYDTYPQIKAHQLCCAHLQRELQPVIDIHDHPPGAWCWAEQIQAALSTMITDPTTVKKGRHLITSAPAAAETDPTTSPKLARKHATLRQRITTRLEDYLRFTTNPDIPATNNPAEQEIRMIKIKQKISTTMRTIKGAQTFCTIRSYLATAHKNHTPPLTALTTLTSPNPWLPTQP